MKVSIFSWRLNRITSIKVNSSHFCGAHAVNIETGLVY